MTDSTERDELDLDPEWWEQGRRDLVALLASHGFDNSGENPHSWRCRWHAEIAAQGKGEPSCTCPQDVATDLLEAGWTSQAQVVQYAKEWAATVAYYHDILDRIGWLLGTPEPVMEEIILDDLPARVGALVDKVKEKEEQ